MSEGVLAALITGACAIVAQLIISWRSNKDIYAKLDKSQAVTETKLESLTTEVREHNNFARRVPVIEQQITAFEKRLDAIEKRIG